MRGCLIALGLASALLTAFVVGAIVNSTLLMFGAFLMWTPAMLFAGWNMRGVRVVNHGDKI